MLAYDYPLLSVFFSFLYFFLFVIWIWIAISVTIDIFRSKDLGGFAKALWVLFVIVLPYLGVFIYLIARGGKMHERQAKEAQASQAAFQEYVQQAAGTTTDVAGQLEKLASLRDRNLLTAEEFEAQKAKLLA
ncbi:MAG TPA: SHOCT domain-containing protein [Microthrixaceae bacterium]|nr:SHOCT domain-containing protein [Microthrixaceae bacterium]